MRAFITQEQAEKRAASVEAGIDYQLFIRLQKGENFSGVGYYTFKLVSTENVFLDFCGKKLDGLTINGNQISEEQIGILWKNGSINFPSELLKVNSENVVEVVFSNSYNHDGKGIHSYIDTDGKQYTYCHGEPYWINRVYPVFDQPDLKGYMNFIIEAPSEWKVIANTNPIKVQSTVNFIEDKELGSEFEKRIKSITPGSSSETNVHIFEKTPLLPSYLFCFVGGQFQEVSYDGSDGETVPMTIYCRESLFSNALEQKRDIFLFCKKGIEFFEPFFRTKYPFHKYDFVFCPEYTIGAMEHPGVITFNDLYLYRSTPTSTQISRRGSTIVHELAHMWFGNLATMKWWNDLWLKESFADFTCFLAIAYFGKSLPFQTADAWIMMNLRKSWGYEEDQMVTTHPIACQVSSTDKADSVFDGITYSKGAAVLKQLYFLIGHEQFSENLGSYFSKYAWKNATLADFIEELSKSKVTNTHEAYDLLKWNKDWIETAGTNDLRAVWDPNVQGASKLIIHQTPVLSNHPTLRYHKIKIAFFDDNANIAEVKDVLVNKAPETIVDFENKNYKAVLLNYEDWDFAKVTLDNHSFDFFLANISKIKCGLSQLLIVRSMHDMVRGALLKGTDFVSKISGNYLEQILSQPQVLEAVFMFLDSALFSYAPLRLWEEESERLFYKVIDLLKKAQEGDQVKMLKSKLISYALNDQTIQELQHIIRNEHPDFQNFTLTKEEEWRVVIKLQTVKFLTDDQKNELKDSLSSNDNSDQKKHALLTITALLADENLTKHLMDSYVSTDRKMSYTEMAHSLRGLSSWKRPIELKEYQNKRFFSDALHLIVNDQKMIAKTFFNEGFPVSEDFDWLIGKLQEMNQALTEKNEYFKILILQKIDDLQRKKAAHSLFK